MCSHHCLFLSGQLTDIIASCSRGSGMWGTLSGPESSSLDRFIHQVNQAAVTIQRWYRCQVQRRRAGAVSLELLLASKREVSVAVGWAYVPQGLVPPAVHTARALGAILKTSQMEVKPGITHKCTAPFCGTYVSSMLLLG